MRVDKFPTNMANSSWVETYPIGDLTPDMIYKFGQVKRTAFTMEEADSDTIENFIKATTQALFATHDVYMVIIESFPQKKSPIRSRKLMFYDHRASIADADRSEVEVDTDKDGQSLMAGAVKLTPQNFEYCTNNLINSNLRFFFIVRRGVSVKWNDFLRKTARERLHFREETVVNIPKIILDHVDKEHSLLILQYFQQADTTQFFVIDEKLQAAIDEMARYVKSVKEN